MTHVLPHDPHLDDPFIVKKESTPVMGPRALREGLTPSTTEDSPPCQTLSTLAEVASEHLGIVAVPAVPKRHRDSSANSACSSTTSRGTSPLRSPQNDSYNMDSPRSAGSSNSALSAESSASYTVPLASKQAANASPVPEPTPVTQAAVSKQAKPAPTLAAPTPAPAAGTAAAAATVAAAASHAVPARAAVSVKRPIVKKTLKPTTTPRIVMPLNKVWITLANAVQGLAVNALTQGKAVQGLAAIPGADSTAPATKEALKKLHLKQSALSASFTELALRALALKKESDAVNKRALQITALEAARRRKAASGRPTNSTNDDASASAQDSVMANNDPKAPPKTPPPRREAAGPVPTANPLAPTNMPSNNPPTANIPSPRDPVATCDRKRDRLHGDSSSSSHVTTAENRWSGSEERISRVDPDCSRDSKRAKSC